jgi:Cu+-exporting ATPase
MEVDKNSTEARSNHAGKTYYFCSESCKDKWNANPEKHAHAEQSA